MMPKGTRTVPRASCSRISARGRAMCWSAAGAAEMMTACSSCGKRPRIFPSGSEIVSWVGNAGASVVAPDPGRGAEFGNEAEGGQGVGFVDTAEGRAGDRLPVREELISEPVFLAPRLSRRPNRLLIIANIV